MEYLKIGLILKPQGIRGEIKVLPLTDDPSRFIGLKQAFLSEEKKPVRIMGARIGKDAVYLFLERIYDRRFTRAIPLYRPRARRKIT